MGIIKLTKSDRNRARSDKWRDENLACFKTPQAMKERMLDQLSDRGVRIEHKPSGPGKLSRMTTAYQNVLRLSSNFKRLHIVWQAAILAHELVHYRQREHFGRHNFNSKYIFSPRWRMSVEIPAYREEVRALTIMGVRDENVADRIDDIPKALKSYSIGVLDFGDLKKFTKKQLIREVERAEEEVA